jgi:tripartite-type tricarboxylate transporter receptor subunit TctC
MNIYDGKNYRQQLIYLQLGFSILLGILSFSIIAAEKYPSKPVRIVVGFAAAGPVDNLSRIIARRLSARLEQQFVVDNRPGASSMIGAQMVASSEPDGYTLLMVASTHAINPSLYKKIAFNTEKDFTPISLIAENPFVLVVPSKLKVSTLADLISLARSDAKPINYASAGIGGLPHLSAELFKLEAGIEANHIPYKGAAPASVDLLAGHVSFMINNMQSALPYIKDGRLRALAVTSPERVSSIPNVPTFREIGYKGLQISGWYGLLAPAGLPLDIVQLLNRQVQLILKEKEVIAEIKSDGAEVIMSTPKEFSDRIRDDMIKWSVIIKSAGISQQ